ncbi:TylF/MycF/NovP-related O-methyltransferase [Pseudodesulfovibrio tunisiensis]|uniref:TylF/MycF/NovP-related O-methyltransferase n=1 Tax=Pseudodesulfovibrio tunisiensis TaxID=463192 RepID=UPI001FB49BB1|nr:TylF/MycF/NovP-related O-methyltransferase [Pseudodesulfovibrio tunisiensis]
MRVTLVSTNDRMGGAARCSIRIWEALRRSETDGVLLCLRRSLSRPGIECVGDRLGPDMVAAMEETWGDLRGKWQRLATDRCVSMVTPPGPGVDISGDPAIGWADVINLHWNTWFLDARNIASLARLGKPLVWTLHDESAFTGGCHYAAECDGFTRACMDCPQVERTARPEIARAFAEKRAVFRDLPLTVVTTSHWLAERARTSVLLGDKRIEVIPSGMDTDVFRPAHSRAAAKRHLGFSPHDRIVLMPASTLEDVRKGARIADAFLDRLACAAKRNPEWGERLKVVFFGGTDRDLSQLPVPAGCLGEMHDEAALARVYAAGDCVVTLSGYDNLPNTVHEAMACATPVAAFDVGGVPDMIEHGKQGFLAAPGDVDALADMTVRLLADSEASERMGACARETAVERYALSVAAKQYESLFRELLDACPVPTVPTRQEPDPVVFPEGAGLRYKAEKTRQQTVAHAIGRAFELRDAGNCGAALDVVDSLLRDMPDDGELALVRGGLLVAAGQPDPAADWLGDLYERRAESRIGLALCDALRIAGRAQDSLELVERMSVANSLLPGLHKKRGQALLALGEPRRALKLFFREYRLHRDKHALELARKLLGKSGPQGPGQSTEPEKERHMKFCLDCNEAEKGIIRACCAYSMTSGERMLGLIRAVEYIARAGIPGDIVECGVWKGGSSMASALALLAHEGADRDLYLFDTFAGMTAPSDRDEAFDGSMAEPVYLESRTPEGASTWCQAGLEEVRTNMLSTGYPEDRIHLVRGPVEQTLPHAAPERIALLRLDTDWYESTRHELEHLYPRLSPGGVLVIDDYGHWKGARKAVDEYIGKHGLKLLLTRMDYTGRLAVKPWGDA